MTNKLKYFIGNWKMFGNFNSFKIVNKINQFSLKSKKQYNKKIILCVPNTLLYSFNKRLKKKSLYLGAQNCHHNKGYGPFTGSVSSSMLKEAGAEYIILGHSENRSEGESNNLIKKKMISAINLKFNIIFCIGETYAEKKSKKTFSVLSKQIRSSLVKNFKNKNFLFAYEPVWSIGSNKIPNMSELRDTINFLKKTISKFSKTAQNPKVLYGGSVNDKNISKFSTVSEIDGFLVGGASQSSKKFIDIIKNYYK
jgi:triosephosphate isomerase (TIM)